MASTIFRHFSILIKHNSNMLPMDIQNKIAPYVHDNEHFCTQLCCEGRVMLNACGKYSNKLVPNLFTLCAHNVMSSKHMKHESCYASHYFQNEFHIALLEKRIQELGQYDTLLTQFFNVLTHIIICIKISYLSIEPTTFRLHSSNSTS